MRNIEINRDSPGSCAIQTHFENKARVLFEHVRSMLQKEAPMLSTLANLLHRHIDPYCCLVLGRRARGHGAVIMSFWCSAICTRKKSTCGTWCRHHFFGCSAALLRIAQASASESESVSWWPLIWVSANPKDTLSASLASSSTVGPVSVTPGIPSPWYGHLPCGFQHDSARPSRGH